MEISRRNLILSGAPALLSAQGANDKVNVGWIASGTRGMHVMKMMYQAVPENVVVSAVCDTYAGNLAKGKDQIQTIGKNTPKTHVDYRDILNDKSIDAVFIMTPEHLHYEMTIAALKAGKHVYVEKPLAHTIEEGQEIVREAKKSGKVVQVGTQNRSNSLYIKAKEMVAQGMIGEVHYVRAFWYRNSQEQSPWNYVIPAESTEQNTDWKRFTGSAKARAFDKDRYFRWRLYWDYSGGISTDLLVHQTDISNFVCGKTEPMSCSASGGLYRWNTEKDKGEVPDTLSALYEYPDKFHINYSCYFGNEQYGYGEQFMGNEGTIEVMNRQVLRFYTEKFRGKPPAHVAARKEFVEEKPGNDIPAVQNHTANFIRAVMGKEKVIAPVEVGQQAAVSGHLATLSLRAGKKVLWDSKTQKHRFV